MRRNIMTEDHEKIMNVYNFLNNFGVNNAANIILCLSFYQCCVFLEISAESCNTRLKPSLSPKYRVLVSHANVELMYERIGIGRISFQAS